jgi:hypothetical protein
MPDKPEITFRGPDLIGRALRALRASGFGCDQIDKLKARMEKVDTLDEKCDILLTHIEIKGRT